jgi:hypothetical protein
LLGVATLSAKDARGTLSTALGRVQKKRPSMRRARRSL